MVSDKREAILNAAIGLFTEFGFQGAPTSKIAKEAGVGTGTLFHYFKTKEELINRLYVEIKKELSSEMSADLDIESTVYGKLKRFWCNTLQWGPKNAQKANFYRLFCASPFITALSKDEARSHLLFLFEIIEEGKRQRIVKDMPTEMLVEIIIGIIQGTAQSLIDTPEKLADKDYLESIYHVLWDSIRQ